MSSPDNQGQMHAATSLQTQLPQMQHHIHSQVRPQSMPVHINQGPNMARMQRPQMMRGGQMPMEPSSGSFVGGQPRMPTGGMIQSQVRMSSQGMMQPQQGAYMTADGNHSMQMGMMDPQRPVVTSYAQPNNVQMFQMGPQNQLRWRHGVPQSSYGHPVRMSGPSPQANQNTAPNAAMQFMPNSGASVPPPVRVMTPTGQMQQVSQQQQQPPQQTPHYLSAEMQQPSPGQPQHRMMVPGGMKAANSMPPAVPQASGGPRPPRESGMPPGAGPGGGGHVPDFQRWLMVVDNAMRQIRAEQPEADLKDYHQLRNAIERPRTATLSQLEMLVRQIQQDPFYLLRRRAAHQQQQQQQHPNAVGSGGPVSEETRQKLLVQKRVAAQASRLAARSAMPVSSPSSLNHLLNQPPDPPIPSSLSYPGLAMPGSVAAAAAAAYRHMQQQQQPPQPMVVSADQTHHHHPPQQQHLPPMDPYVVAMDKVTQDLASLEREKGTELFNAARKAIAEMSRSLLEARGSLLPLSLLSSPTPDSVETKTEKPESPPRDESLSTLTGSKKRAAENGLDSAEENGLDEEASEGEEEPEAPRRKQPKTEGAPQSMLLVNGKLTTHEGLSLEDLHPRILREIEEVRKSLPGVAVELVENPSPADVPAAASTEESTMYPCMDELDSHVSCDGVSEWNESVHLRLTYSDALLPCAIPPLYVRLPSTYLEHGQVGGWLTHQSEYLNPPKKQRRKREEEVNGEDEWPSEEEGDDDDGQAVGEGEGMEVAKFIQKAGAGVAESLSVLKRQRNSDAISLSTLVDAWLRPILMALTEQVAPQI